MPYLLAVLLPIWSFVIDPLLLVWIVCIFKFSMAAAHWKCCMYFFLCSCNHSIALQFAYSPFSNGSTTHITLSCIHALPISPLLCERVWPKMGLCLMCVLFLIEKQRIFSNWYFLCQQERVERERGQLVPYEIQMCDSCIWPVSLYSIFCRYMYVY